MYTVSMNSDELQHIIVSKVRKDFEQKRVPKSVLIELYSKYTPEVDATRFVEEAEKIFPKLSCGLTSVYLKHILGEGEVVQGTYEKHKHTFLKVSHGLIVDITADQYGGPRVYVGRIQEPWSLY